MRNQVRHSLLSPLIVSVMTSLLGDFYLESLSLQVCPNFSKLWNPTHSNFLASKSFFGVIYRSYGLSSARGFAITSVYNQKKCNIKWKATQKNWNC